MSDYVPTPVLTRIHRAVEGFSDIQTRGSSPSDRDRGQDRGRDLVSLGVRDLLRGQDRKGRETSTEVSFRQFTGDTSLPSLLLLTSSVSVWDQMSLPFVTPDPFVTRVMSDILCRRG